ncbi:MAG TPA: hypothetical protein VFT86_01965 [Gaiellaceae bacterium]|nr:hypothetical protein [Gaiellaceae bacterium]
MPDLPTGTVTFLFRQQDLDAGCPSSIASGRPSRRRQISATAPLAAKSGRTARARSPKAREELAMGADFYPIAEEIRERTLDQARARLSDAAFAEAWAQGDALSLEEAAELAARV